jgi:CRISPR system Cascade subunit CasE
MYLSQLVLNERERKIYQDLNNAHKFHQRIMQGFPDQDTPTPRQDWHILYRQELDSLTILVQSAIAPDWERLPGNYLASAQVKSFDWSPAVLKPGTLYQFRLQANPSKRDSKTRKTIGFFKREDQLIWLERQGEQKGFKVHDVLVIPAPQIFGVKGKGIRPIQIHTVLFQGVLSVMDSSLFLQSLQTGIGKGKSYGCGLLSIAKI